MRLLITVLILLWSSVAIAEVKLISVQNSVFGEVGIRDDGYVVFVPDQDFYGAARFEYTITDEATGRTATGYVYISIEPQPEPLIAGDILARTNEDREVEIPIDLIISNNNANAPDPVVTNPPGSVVIPEGLQ